MRIKTTLAIMAFYSVALAQPSGISLPVNQLADSGIRLLSHKDALKSAMLKADEEPISDVPGGDEVVYALSASGYSYDYGYLMQNSHNIAAYMVYCDNNEVYIKDPASFISIGTYLKGKIDGNEIKVELPQPIAYYQDAEGNTGIAYLNKMRREGQDWNVWYYNVGEGNEATYLVDGDKITLDLGQSSEGSNEYILGITFDNDIDSEASWSGYGDYYQVYEKFKGEIEMPSDMSKIEDGWIVRSEEEGNHIMFAECDGKIYLHGIGNSFDDDNLDWIHGVLNGSECTFSSGQYVGSLPNAGFLYAMFATAEKIVSEWGTYYNYGLIDEVKADYDPISKKLVFPKGIALLYNVGTEQLYYWEAKNEMQVYYQDPNITLCEPKAPVFTYVGEFDPRNGSASVQFDLSMFDVNDNLLEHSRMFYEVFVDELPFYFATEEYPCFENDTYEIPYDYSDYYSYLVTGGPFVYHGFTYFFMGAESIGIQSCYRDKNDIVLRSAITTHYFVPASIDDAAEQSQPISTEYYTISGIKVDNPDPGVYIVKEIFNDGSVKASKRFVK